jgi:hypothetical protein
MKVHTQVATVTKPQQAQTTNSSSAHRDSFDVSADNSSTCHSSSGGRAGRVYSRKL